MQDRELVNGFSELKDLLIREYKIDRDRSSVKLFFSEKDNSLIMHDYNDHKKVLILSFNIIKKEIWRGLSNYAQRLVMEALNSDSPSHFLIESFRLYGFFRS